MTQFQGETGTKLQIVSLHDSNISSSSSDQHQETSSFPVVAASLHEDSESTCGTNSNDEDNATHGSFSLALLALCGCSISNSLLLISLFPYSGYMVIHLLPNETSEQPEIVGIYAGWLASCFMFGRLVTAYGYGILADRYGRIVVLQTILTLSAIFSVLFGLSQSYTEAIIWRTCLGMVNSGIISIIKTLSLEIAHGNTDREVHGMGLVMGSRSYGMLMAPTIGGFLAEPIKQYAKLDRWLLSQQDNEIYPWIYSMLQKYPFLLPNVAVAAICLISCVGVTCFVEETLIADKRRHPKWMLFDLYTRIVSTLSAINAGIRNILSKPVGTTEEKRVLLPIDNKSAGSSSPSLVAITEEPSVSLWGMPITRRHMMTHWLFSFFNTSVDEAFPLFCMSQIGGLSLPEYSIGQILSLAGLIFVCFQYVVYSKVIKWYGLYKAISIGCIGSIIPVMFFPLSLTFQQHEKSYQGWFVHIFLSILMGSIKVMTCLYFTSISLATNRTVPTKQRAKLNSIITIGISIAKGFGPIVAGGLVTISFSTSTSSLIPIQGLPRLLPQAKYGSIVIFSALVVLGLCVYTRVRYLERTMTEKEKEDTTKQQDIEKQHSTISTVSSSSDDCESKKRVHDF